MLIEIHMLQNHAPSNLNRDDTGSPKECIFGGHRRARISSQCLKRSIRKSELFEAALKDQMGTRTRRLPDLVRERLIENGISDELADIAAKKATGFGNRDGNEQDSLQTAQTMFLTSHDIEAVVGVLQAAAKESEDLKKFQKTKAADLQKSAKQKGFRPLCVDVALFGRMITSEAFRDVEASIQVAHAISTHKVDHEYDYFTAVDDLKNNQEEEEDAGADMIGDVEFNSACYYKYFSIDRKGLIDNLTGKAAGRAELPQEDISAARELADKSILAFLESGIRATPTGKQNTFAAHQLPAAVLVEVRSKRTPVAYTNAFVEPARPGRDGDLVTASLCKFADHVSATTAGYNLESTARLMLAPEFPDFSIEATEKVNNLNTMMERLRQVMQDG